MVDKSPGSIDFSALDPCRNQLRWARTVDQLAARALADRHRRLSVEHQLLSWARPVLTVAAALCITAWTAGYLTSVRHNASTATPATAPALQIATWAANDKVPDSSELSGTLGGIP